MSYTNQYDPLFQQIGNQYGFDPNLLKTIAIKESGINPNVSDNYNTNGTIDVGLMQINNGDSSIFNKYGYDALKTNPATSIQAAAETLQEKVGILQNRGMTVNNYNLLWAYNGLSHQGQQYANDAFQKYLLLSSGNDVSPTNSGSPGAPNTGGTTVDKTTLLSQPSRIFWLVLGGAVVLLGLYVAVNPLANLSNVVENLGEKK